MNSKSDRKNQSCKFKIFNHLLDKLKDTKHITISNIFDSARPLIISKLFDTPLFKDQPVFWLVKSEKEGHKIKNFINLFGKICGIKIKINIFPSTEEEQDLESNFEANRILSQLVKNNIELLLIPLEIFSVKLPSLAAMSKNTLNFEPTDNIDLDSVLKKLIKIGYERHNFASSPGFFSIKGDIIDIFPINYTHPIRLEIFGNKVESISQINPKDKNKLKSLSCIEIIPININDKSYGNIIDYLTVNSSLSNKLIYVFNEEEEILNELEFINPKIVKPLKTLTNKNYKLSFSDLPDQNKNIINFNFYKAPLYYYNLNNFQQDIINKIKKGWRIIFFTKNKEKIISTLKFNSLNIYYLEDQELPDYPSGFISENEKFALITDSEIFGIKKSKNLKKDIKFISELKPGDYIVHYDHGIGKFVGMTKREIDEGTREFFILEYAKGDKLFLPVEYSEKITKYIGVTHPKIHRLHEASWSQVKERIKKKAEQIAKELISIYAQRESKKGFKFSQDNNIMLELYENFPYQETPDQTKVWQEVKSDMEKLPQEKPMDRLICGDVGFGKTEIAIRAAVKAVQDHKQVALLCPTTILAQQHYDTFVNRLNNFDVKVDVLSRFKNFSEQNKSVEDINFGKIDIIIGTHRLLSQDIKFKDLGLLIIDEEQKFGVKHKERLKEFKSNVDVLTLTATPIPRTMNLSLSGLRDISTIETPPEGRSSVKTIIRKFDNEIIQQAIKKELARNGQVYYLHNRVETIQAAAKKLKLLFPNATLGIAHGQLPEKKLAEVMHQFDQNKIKILVCSSIIENGLDLPNVNTLIVDKSTNFGLSSLYQLRGRIGRSDKKAYAYFLYQDTDLKEQARKRLQALLEAKELGSGFKLALRDLEIRGVGNILGKEQSGNVNTIGLNLYTRLLNNAVQKLQTGFIEKEFDVSIDLPLSAYIPVSTIKDDKKRIYTYQEIANLNNLHDLKKYQADITQKLNLNKLPPELINLFEIIYIKILCRRANIENIDAKIITRPTGETLKKIIITPLGQVNYDKARKLLQTNPHWEVYENNLKIDMEYLGNNWLGELKKDLEVLSNKKELSN